MGLCMIGKRLTLLFPRQWCEWILVQHKHLQVIPLESILKNKIPLYRYNNSHVKRNTFTKSSAWNRSGPVAKTRAGHFYCAPPPPNVFEPNGRPDDGQY